MTLHKLTAGDGYTYLTRQVAAHDATTRGFDNLGDYYSEKGEAPGVWMGRGLAAVPDFSVGDRVTDISRIAPAMERYPDVKVAFEHSWGHKVGAPPDYSVLQPLFDLSQNPNVYIKTAINNMAAARDGGGTPAALYTKLVEVFGAKRIMWSSNYPAHPKFGGVKSRLDESKKALAHLSADDQAWILGKTALAFYPALAK